MNLDIFKFLDRIPKENSAEILGHLNLFPEDEDYFIRLAEAKTANKNLLKLLQAKHSNAVIVLMQNANDVGHIAKFVAELYEKNEELERQVQELQDDIRSIKFKLDIE